MLAPTLVGCATRDDDYLLLRRTPAAAGAPTRLTTAPPNDAEAYYVRHLLASGFGAELMRTYAMTKRFAAQTAGYRERETTITLGRPDAAARDRARRVQIGWWTDEADGDAPIIWIDDSPERGARSSMADLVSGFARRDRRRDRARDRRALRGSASLRDGYVAFLQVVGSEWRPPRATDDRDELRRLGVVAHVRANDAVLADREAASTWVMRDRPAPQTRPGQDDARRSAGRRERALPSGVVRARPEDGRPRRLPAVPRGAARRATSTPRCCWARSGTSRRS